MSYLPELKLPVPSPGPDELMLGEGGVGGAAKVTAKGRTGAGLDAGGNGGKVLGTGFGGPGGDRWAL